MILRTCIINDDGKFYQQIFLEEALYNKYAQRKALKRENWRNNADTAAFKNIAEFLSAKKW